MALAADPKTPKRDSVHYKPIVPSHIQKYFYYVNCQLYIFSKQPVEQKGRLSEDQQNPDSPPGDSEITPQKRGKDWEKGLINRLAAGNEIIRFTTGDSGLWEQIKNDKRGLKHFYVENYSFYKHNLFEKEYVSRGKKPLVFGTFRPDLIEIWEKERAGVQVFEYRVIDAKSTPKRVQVNILEFKCSLLVLSSGTSVPLFMRFERSASV